VPSRPMTACETARSCWIDGKSGPAPTIWGRNVSPARNSATRTPREEPFTRLSASLAPPAADDLLGAADVRARLCSGACPVARSHRLHDCDVEIDELHRLEVRPVDAERGGHLDPEREPRLQQD